MKVQTVDLNTLSSAQLDDIFRGSPPGPIPVGKSRGTAILFPQSFIERALQGFIRALIWKGKVFRPDSKDLKNRMGPFGNLAIRAKVYEDQSWFSSGPAIIIDYSKTSIVARFVRDEIREVSPGLYLGQIFLGKKRIGHFMLEFPALVSA
jgi:hypothetical protein